MSRTYGNTKPHTNKSQYKPFRQEVFDPEPNQTTTQPSEPAELAEETKSNPNRTGLEDEEEEGS